jgi:DegV family protein with EDD domain
MNERGREADAFRDLGATGIRARGFRSSAQSVALCTDSSSLLDPSEAASLGVDIVPIPVTLDGMPFDEVMSSLDWFYERIRAGAAPATSQPSPADFGAAYDRAAARGAQTVVSIHLDSRVSGTVNAAELAARASRIPVTVVDTRTVSYGVTLCVRAAAELIAAGGSAGDAALEASRLGAQLENCFVALGGSGGRVPEGAGWMLLRFAGGGASPIWQCASVSEALAHMTTLVVGGDGEVSAAVGHAGMAMQTHADELAQRIERSGRAARVERYRVGPSVGAHTGPDSFGAFWRLGEARPTR